MTSTASAGMAAPRPGLTRQRIVDAAVALVDAEGIEALSMRRLGKELGVEAMSLYNHIPSKSALIDAVVDHVIESVPPPSASDEWQERARQMARSYRTIAHRHPRIVPLIAMRPFNTVTALKPVERAFGILCDAGFEGADVLHAFRTLAGFATGYILAETGGFFGEPEERDDYHMDPDDLSGVEFPNLVEMLPHIAGCDHEVEFEWGLDVILTGLQEKLRRLNRA